jgi:cyclin A
MLTENMCIRDALADMETDDKIVNVDDNYQDPQLCATIACDIYKHLRASEVEYSSLCANYESPL